MTADRIVIPETIDEAGATLNGIDRLLTARKWERSAIVYAFTRDGLGEGRNTQKVSESTNLLTPNQFAALKLSGLSSDKTVRNYRDAWKRAIQDGYATHVEPGDAVELPDAEEHPFPPTGGNSLDSPRDRDQEAVTRFLESPATTGERKAEVVANALQDDYVAQEVAKRIGADEELSARLERARRERQHNEVKPRQPSPAIDDWQNWTASQQEEFDRKTINAVRHILKALFIREQGYVSSGEAEMLLALIDKSDLDTELEELLRAGGAA